MYACHVCIYMRIYIYMYDPSRLPAFASSQPPALNSDQNPQNWEGYTTRGSCSYPTAYPNSPNQKAASPVSLRLTKRHTVDSRKLEYGPGTIHAGFPSSPGVGARKQSYSNFLASTVDQCGIDRPGPLLRKLPGRKKMQNNSLLGSSSGFEPLL